METPPLNELAAFTRVANRLSFKRASEELNISASTLSHLIRSLEERLQTRLFNRTTRSVALTEAGQAFYTQLDPILGHLTQVVNGLASLNAEPRGNIRISSGDIAATWLAKRIDPKFYEKYPHVNLEVIVDNSMIDIVAEGFDAGIRLHKSLPVDMVAIPILERFRFVAVATNSYLNKYGVPKKPADLLEHSCVRIRFNNGRIGEWQFEKRGKTISVDVTGSITTNNPGVMIESAKKSRAIAYVAEPLVQDEISSGKLKVLLDGWSPHTPGLYLYYPKNRHMPSGLRALVNSLKKS